MRLENIVFERNYVSISDALTNVEQVDFYPQKIDCCEDVD